MSRRSEADQLELPIGTLQRRTRGRESREFHAAVVALRRSGKRIYRGGRYRAIIDGEYHHPIRVLALHKAASGEDGR